MRFPEEPARRDRGHRPKHAATRLSPPEAHAEMLRGMRRRRNNF
jgi:hypothetical protein